MYDVRTAQKNLLFYSMQRIQRQCENRTHKKIKYNNMNQCVSVFILAYLRINVWVKWFGCRKTFHQHSLHHFGQIMANWCPQLINVVVQLYTFNRFFFRFVCRLSHQMYVTTQFQKYNLARKNCKITAKPQIINSVRTLTTFIIVGCAEINLNRFGTRKGRKFNFKNVDKSFLNQFFFLIYFFWVR